MNDPKTGVYFHEKCLEISRLTSDRRGEMSANHRLGLVYDKMVGGRSPALRPRMVVPLTQTTVLAFLPSNIAHSGNLTVLYVYDPRPPYLRSLINTPLRARNPFPLHIVCLISCKLDEFKTRSGFVRLEIVCSKPLCCTV